MEASIHDWISMDGNLIVGFGFVEDHTIAVVIHDFYPYLYVKEEAILPPYPKFRKVRKVKKGLLRGAYVRSLQEPFLELYFENDDMMKKFVLRCKERGTETFEGNLSVEERFLLDKGINRIDQIRFVAHPNRKKITTLENEYHCSAQDVERSCSVSPTNHLSPLILSMDIEAYSSSKNRMPDPDLEPNLTFMISAVIWRCGTKEAKRYILHCCKVDILLQDVEVRRFASETDMILGYFHLVNETDPDVITGYNIFKFDFEYIRCRLRRKLIPLPNTSRILEGETEEKQMKWHSSAYGHNDFLMLDAKGRCSFDLYQYVLREYKLSEYSLSSVASHFVEDKKIDLNPTAMFSMYLKGDEDSIRRIAEYCLHDSVLVMNLFEELEVWVTLVELSKVTGIPLKDLYTRGQQTRVLSLLRKECKSQDLLMTESKEVRRLDYEGAYVVEPTPGIYRQCFSLDFSSLYPSIIISYNICYSTYIPDYLLDDFLPQEYHSVDVGHGRMCCFLKEPPGIVPSLLKNLIEQRKTTKKSMKTETRPNVITVLDKRQWAYKISANSVYGSYGTRNEPYLQFMEGAESTTAAGRESMKKAIDIIESQYDAKVIYGDTDSCIISCESSLDLSHQDVRLRGEEGRGPRPRSPSTPETSTCEKMAEEVSSHFPPPLRLEFENIYESFLIASKKRYAGLVRTKGEFKVVFKGLVPVRRDRCDFVRSLYREALEIILRRRENENVRDHIRDRLLDLIRGKITIEDMIIRRTLNDVYKLSSNPQLLFANRLRERGEIVEPGTRLEFVFTKNPGRLQGEKMELANQVTFEDLDLLYYLEKHIAPPIDDLLKVAGMEEYVGILVNYIKLFNLTI